MALIASIDGPNRRIYLSIDTVDADVHPMDVYKEMRTLRKDDEDLRKYDLFLSGEGKIPKIPGKFTERFVVCNSGTRIVPYDSSGIIKITGVIISDDGVEGRDCFDRTSLTPGVEVDIDYQPPQVEVIEIVTGGGDTAAIATAVWANTDTNTGTQKGKLLEETKDKAALAAVIFEAAVALARVCCSFKPAIIAVASFLSIAPEIT
jgi:hypothetical protein